MTPNKAWTLNPQEQQKLWQFQFGDNTPTGEYTDLKVGDYVRVSKNKGIFGKGYEISWSPEVFIIDRISNLKPALFYLKDKLNEEIWGGWYREELQKTQVPDAFLVEKVLKKNKQNGVEKYLVRWFELPEKHDSWIDANEVVEVFYD